MSLDSTGKNDEYDIALALTIIDGCFSFVYCNVVCDCTMAKETSNCTGIKYNDLRTDYKAELRIVKQSGVTLNASCKFNLQLDTIVAQPQQQSIPNYASYFICNRKNRGKF
ncbi:hypothetical protein JTE90_011434 [Oedothorax gibbosus]|uniref:Uncharacterized protein n=1 Tax=Oedothorax gibbosus TaxID=931172 RepID=A0AAV6VB66_9ARAC|nr:hypothetical protein JTE90_011434 [Oedothorax gibbosus]